MRRLGGSMLLLGALAALGGPGAVQQSQQAAVQQAAPANGNIGKQSANVPVSAGVNVILPAALLPNGLRRMFGNGPVWNGVAKRGNRRRRARHNYNR
jgi:hypothetical protein